MKFIALKHIPRLALNRSEVALAFSVAPNMVDAMVKEGVLPQPRVWYSRKFWRVTEIDAAMNEWPTADKQESDASQWCEFT